jgi:hypothetical protein
MVVAVVADAFEPGASALTLREQADYLDAERKQGNGG